MAERIGVDPDAAPIELVDLVIEDARWEAAGIAEIAETAACAALEGVGLVPRDHEVSLLACDDARIAALNSAFRDRDRPTNVLSWPHFDLAPGAPGQAPPAPPAGLAGEERVFLGDLALAYETCLREAEGNGPGFRDHAAHLIVHGCLHLLGYDHQTEEDAALMEGLETKILARLGIANPYR